MKRVALPVVILCVAVMAIGAGLTGCQPDTPSGANGSTASKPATPPTPEERFQRIVTTFRNAIDTDASGVRTGIRYDDTSGHSSISVRKSVTDVKLIPPTKEGEPYRGTITVVRNISYSMRMSAPNSGNGESATRNGDSDQQESLDASSGNGVDVLDPNLMAAATKSDSPGPVPEDEVVARRTDEDERTYELEYENGRWVLITKPDPKTEQSIAYAFEHALAIQ